MTDIFLSYAREDRQRAGKLARALEARNFNVWWDRKIEAGQPFDQVIEHYLETAKCVVVLWSNASVSSEWVKNEASHAMEREVLVPVAIDRVKPPLEFRRRQTVDLSGWNGSTIHEGFEVLCDGISAITKGTTLRKSMRPRLESFLINRLWLAGVFSILLVVLSIAVYSLRPLPPWPTPAVISGDVEYSGTAKWRSPRAGDRAVTTNFQLNLHFNGTDVEGEYTDASGDNGTLRLKINGNSLNGDVVSETEGVTGRCSWRGTLSSNGSTLDATYHCPDGERGDLQLRRQ